MLGEVGGLDTVAEATIPASGAPMADQGLEQRRLPGAVRADERHVLLALDHEGSPVDRLAAGESRRPSISITVRPLRAGLRNSKPRVRRRRVRFSSPLRGLLSLLLESADLGELGLRLLRLRLLVAEPFDESFQPLDIVADPRDRLRGCLRAGRRLQPPRCHGPGEVQAAPALDLEYGGRDRLEEPAVMRDEHAGGVDRGQFPLEPLEAVDVEMVRRLVEEQQVGVAGEGAASEARVSSPPEKVAS